MALDTKVVAALAEHLENAELKAKDVTKITDDHPEMDWDDAYAIQDEIRRRKESRGSKIVGLKAGLTSFAKMKQMGVATPVFGFVADNTSSSRFVVGGRMRHLSDLDLSTLGVVLEKNGEIVTMAAGAAVLGNPLAAVAMLANHLAGRDQEIPAGTLIMTGGVTEAIPVTAGDNVSSRFQDLGTVSIRFV